MFIVLLTFLSIVVLIIIWLKWRYFYWRKKGVIQLEPSLFFGNVKKLLFMKQTEFEMFHEMYTCCSSEEPAVGYYNMGRPALLIRNFSLAKTVLEHQFDNFNQNYWYNEPCDLVLKHHPKYTTDDKQWKFLSNFISQLVVTSKISQILPNIVICCNNMVEYFLENKIKFDANQIGAFYAADTSIRSVYGLHSDSFGNPNTIYRQINEALFNTHYPRISLLTCNMGPKIDKLVKSLLISNRFNDFYVNTVQDSIQYRSKYDIEMNDFLQFIIGLNEKDDSIFLKMEDISGHCLTFLSEAFSTCKFVVCCILDLLSKHSQIQNDLRNEIDEKIQSKDDVSYDTLKSMKYMEAFVSEVLRLRPPIPVVHKVCTKDVILEEGDRQYPIKVGDIITIPILSIQSDEAYFQDPLMFKPEKFLPHYELEGFFPFGLGPKSCPGQDFAMMQIKSFVVAILKNFRIVNDKVDEDIAFDERNHFYLPKKKTIWIKLISLEDENEERLI